MASPRGGPVWIPKVYNGHDKTFFFFNWEQFRETTKVNNQFQTVPTAAYRTGDFSHGDRPDARSSAPIRSADQMLEGMVYDPATTANRRRCAGLSDPVSGQHRFPVSAFDPVAAKIQSLFPQPNGPTPSGLTNNYLNVYKPREPPKFPPSRSIKQSAPKENCRSSGSTQKPQIRTATPSSARPTACRIRSPARSAHSRMRRFIA